MKNAKKTALFNIILTFLLVASLALSAVGCEKTPNDTSKDVSNDNSPEVSDVSETKVFTAEEHYNLAKELINEEKYEEAYNHLIECKDYKDTDEILDCFVLRYKHIEAYDQDGELYGKMEHNYDKNGNILLESDYDADGEMLYKTEYEYDDEGNLILQKDYNKDSYYETTYNKEEMPLSEKGYGEVDGNKINFNMTYKYDETGTNLLEFHHYRDDVLTYSYKKTYEGNKETIIYYDEENGEVDETAEIIKDDKGNTISRKVLNVDEDHTNSYDYRYTYDENGNILTEESGFSGVFYDKTVYSYYENGEIKSVKSYGDGVPVSEMEYNEFGAIVLQKVYELGKLSCTIENVYDEFGNFITSTSYDAKGEIIDRYTYTGTGLIVLYFPEEIE